MSPHSASAPAPDNQVNKSIDTEQLWQTLKQETRLRAEAEPVLTSFFHASVLHHENLSSSLIYLLSTTLESNLVPAMVIRELAEQAINNDAQILQSACADLHAVRISDPACRYYSTPFLFYKGFHSLQSYRIAHWLWQHDRHSIALYLQSRISSKFAVDIHPAARIGAGVFLDHASGIVIGETCVIEDDVSLYQDVTLGGTGKEGGDRHPKVRRGALISTGAKVLGNIEIGEGAKVAAGSVVLRNVPPHTTVAGVPAEPVGTPDSDMPSRDLNQDFTNDRNN